MNKESGNIWFADPEPPEPMTLVERIAVTALILASGATAVGILHWLYELALSSF